MSYFANKPIQYAGVKYMPGQEIKNFGSGMYDDILLENGTIGTDGVGTGIEDRIANQKERRKATYINHESERRDEEAWNSDYDKFGGANERVPV